MNRNVGLSVLTAKMEHVVKMAQNSGRANFKQIQVVSKTTQTHSIVKQTTCTGDELEKYLRNINGDLADEFLKTGKWPKEIQVPKASNVLTKNGAIDWSQVPNDGYVLDDAGNAIKKPHVPKIGSNLDRYSSEEGIFSSPFENGNAFDYDQRSLPYVEDPSKYHQYEVIGDFSNITTYIDQADPQLKSVISDYMSRWNMTNEDLVIQAGEIAEGFGSNGGGIQWRMPLPMKILEDLNLIAKTF